uniref:Integrin beta n=1 Tax=Ciona savignyi TaxID=51511 RepID=H2YKU2_CIOSA
VVQLRPQVIDINLRKGDTVKFNVSFRKVKDYPVDLYYVMDLSNSMKDDLAELQKLGESLATQIRQNVTSDINMGFGTFVDKVMMPFTSTVPDQLINPCAKSKEACAPPFGFRHQQSISGDLTAFKQSVQNTNISGNIDSPEGGFDALMQIAVCGVSGWVRGLCNSVAGYWDEWMAYQGQIGWRGDASHLVVFTTDASFHTALDGKLAAILDANDMKCHLKRVRGTLALVYDKSKELDYPSIGQLRAAFVANKIQPIFAVTKETILAKKFKKNLVFHHIVAITVCVGGVLYFTLGLFSITLFLVQGLKELIPNSFVDELASDSNNIISIIKTAYNKLQMSLDDDNKPEGVGISYRTLCPNATTWSDNSLSCNQIQLGSEVTYEFTVTATACPTTSASNTMLFTSSSLQESVTFRFNFLCNCNCSSMVEQKSIDCSSNGSMVCGACLCDQGHEGSRCQCTQNTIGLSLSAQCKRSDSADICERNGECLCGICDCHENFHGKYCQCSNTGCPVTDGNNCYNQPKCNCTAKINNIPYTLDNVGSCTCHESNCIDPSNPNATVCSSHGNCSCSICECDPKYDGKYCQDCNSPLCKTVTAECSSHEACAICVNSAVQNREVIPIRFLIPPPFRSSLVLNNQPGKQHYISLDLFLRQRLAHKRNRPGNCPKPIDPVIIVLPIVAGIVVLGMIALIAWKVYQTWRDKREWQVFENEMKKSKWTKGQNPIFEEASTRFENPTFHGT